MSDFPQSLSGSILEWPLRALTKEDFTSCTDIAFGGAAQGTRWERYTFRSKTRLRNEPNELSGPFVYTLWCRRSGPRIALLSVARRIVDAFCDQLAREVLGLRLRPISIAVDALVKALVERPTNYAMCFAYARLPAFGAALRTASFFGDDLGESSFFRENLSLMTFYTCGLRQTVGGHEIMRIGSDGRLQFHATDTTKFLEVEEVLTFLRAEGYLQSDVFPEK